MTKEEIFSGISEHTIKGVMIHEQLADYYCFLGLYGYEKFQCKRYIEESKTLRKVHSYYTKHYHKLIPETKFDTPNVIPSNLYKYETNDLAINDIRSAVKTTLNMWVKWEKETKELYEMYYKELISLGEIAAADFVLCLVKDVDDELIKAQCYISTKTNTDYDMGTIMSEQHFK